MLLAAPAGMVSRGTLRTSRRSCVSCVPAGTYAVATITVPASVSPSIGAWPLADCDPTKRNTRTAVAVPANTAESVHLSLNTQPSWCSPLGGLQGRELIAGARWTLDVIAMD